MKKTIAALAVAITVLSLSAAIAAGDDVPSKYGLRLVAFTPTDSELRDVKSMWLGPALDWFLEKDEDDQPTSYLSLAMVSSGDGDLQAKMYPLTYTRVNRTPISATRTKYSGYGVGAYMLKAEAFGNSDTALRFGVHGLYGQEFGGNYFAELRLELVPRFSNVRWSGVSLSVGSRVSF